jgi:hypothetical protein
MKKTRGTSGRPQASTEHVSTLTPGELFEQTASLLAERILLLRAIPDVPNYLHAETVALHVRKIVEGIAFGVLSALEHGSLELSRQRTTDADKLLRFLNSKGLLRLPNAQDVRSGEGGLAAIIMGAGVRDLSLHDLMQTFSLASSIIHERHPEKLSPAVTARLYSEIRTAAAKLDAWLWSHTFFFVDSKTKQQKSFLIQMSLFGRPGFIHELEKIAEPPGSDP